MTKRGAGSSIDHYIQDATEIYLAAELQKIAELNNVAISDCSATQESEWTTYCADRQVMSKFIASKYKKNVDATKSAIISELITKYPNRKFYFTCVDAEFRNKNLKGDLLITFDNCDQISVSVKNYKNGFDSIQVCSGTFNSTLNNFLFDNTECSPGIYKDANGNKFKGSNRTDRDNLVADVSPNTLPYYHKLDAINDKVRSFYITSDKAEYWDNIATKWQSDCQEIGTEVAKTITDAVNNIDNSLVLKRLLKATGIVSDEHLLCLGKGNFLFSLTNDKYARLKDRLSNATRVNTYNRGQSIFYDICDISGTILTINQPCTLQKNGAWHALNEDRFDGVRAVSYTHLRAHET